MTGDLECNGSLHKNVWMSALSDLAIPSLFFLENGEEDEAREVLCFFHPAIDFSGQAFSISGLVRTDGSKDPAAEPETGERFAYAKAEFRPAVCEDAKRRRKDNVRKA